MEQRLYFKMQAHYKEKSLKSKLVNHVLNKLFLSSKH